jgi:hypothetical protein
MLAITEWGRRSSPGHRSLGKRLADKPLDPLGALSLSKRRRPYCMVTAEAVLPQ